MKIKASDKALALVLDNFVVALQNEYERAIDAEMARIRAVIGPRVAKEEAQLQPALAMEAK